MAGIIVTGNHPRRYLPGILKWYGDSYKDFPKEYTEFMTVIKSDKRYEDVALLAGMGLATVKTEAKSIDYDDFKQAYLSRFEHVVYAKGFAISKEALRDDLYNPNLVQIGSKFMAKSILNTKETLCANLLNGAFSTTVVNYPVTNTGGDGKALCVTNHLLTKSSSTGQNTLTTAADLSEASLEQAFIDIANIVDEAGMKAVVMPRKLIVHRNDYFNAKRILGSEMRPDTANNDINALKALDLIPEGYRMNHFLTGASAWFIVTSENDNGLILAEREQDELEADNDFDTKNAKFTAEFRGVAYWADWRGVYGSAGA